MANPRVGQRDSQGRYWTGSGWKSLSDVMKAQQKLPGTVGQTENLPGVGQIQYTGSRYGWQTSATVRSRQQPESSQPPKPEPKPEPKLASRNAEGKFYTGPKYGYQSWQTATAKRLLPSEVLGSEPPSKSRQTPPPAPPLPPPQQPRSIPVQPYKAPSQPPASQVRDTTKVQSSPPQTGDRTKDLRTWALANKGMIDKVGTKSQREILKAAQSGGSIPMPAPRPLITKEEKMDAFDLVLEYLTSEGHVESLDEALYVMMEMDSETIQSICEAAKDQSDKQIEKGVKTTYKAGNVLDNLHQGRSRGLNRLSATERAAKIERMRKRLKARRDNLFGERNKREDAAREEMRRKYGL